MKKILSVAICVVICLSAVVSCSGSRGRSYNIVFDDGVQQVQRRCESGVVLNIPEPTARVGYDVVWEKMSFGDIRSNTTVKAIYTPKDYSVTLDLDGGAFDFDADETFIVKFDSAYTLPSVSKNGFYFDGWSYGDRKIASSGKWNIAADVTLRANWSENPPVEVTVTFDLNGGEFVNADTSSTARYTVGQYYSLPSATKSGYYFVSWKNGDEYLVNEGTWTIETDVTLVAEYGEKIKVIFKQDGYDDVVREVVPGQSLTSVPTPKPVKGYDVAWNVTNFKNITESMTVTVVKSPKEYTATFKYQDQIDTMRVEYGASFKFPIETIAWKREGAMENLSGTVAYEYDDNVTFVPVDYTVTIIIPTGYDMPTFSKNEFSCQGLTNIVPHFNKLYKNTTQDTYTVKGFTVEGDNSGKTYQENDEFIITEDIIIMVRLLMQWTPNY